MSRAGWFLAAAALCCFSWRLFHAPAMGLANNGDFAKIAGPLRLGPASGSTDDRFLYITREYRRAPEHAWDSHYYSSEAVFALAAYELSCLFERRDHFDIRWMGLVHLAVILAALLWLMAALRPLGTIAQLTAGGLAILIYADPAYLAYCNSFYTDAAALAGILLAVAALTDLAVRGASTWRLVGFTLGALLVVTSKTQHTPLALPLAIMLPAVVQQRRAIAAAAIVLCGGLAMWLVSQPTYRADPTFNLVFYKLTPQSPTPLEDLAALGLDHDDARFIGMHAYMPGALTSSYEAGMELIRRATLGRLVRFYLTHSKRTGAILWRDLAEKADRIQVAELGNYPADSGFPPRTHAAAYWTRLRSVLLQRAPWLSPLWLLAAAVVCAAIHSRLSMVCLGAIALAVVEFAVASLGDALDTSRHLLLFQVLCEITICFAATYAAILISLRAGSWYRSWRRDTSRLRECTPRSPSPSQARW